ncbi:uncharacterized protein LOC114310602 [Camellia sinensis]|uniref:uncharacterized protein LOC114310602 n=1 Tax=Camellia sinensis TaxID=4442 RepID=UPI00103622D9|nr:uncharacterized protein LOC114310602 [Camellia sinensis]
MNLDDNSTVPKVIQDELSIVTPREDLNSIATLNNDQCLAFNSIMGAVECNTGAIFFVDGPGGTRKTYLYRALLASVRSQGRIAIATATSGIPATLLPGGRTAPFKIQDPIKSRGFIHITAVDYPFGGKIMVFGGDFRQVLPVVPKGTKAETIAASIVKSPLWSHIQILRLKQNMRSINDQQFGEFLLRVGDGAFSRLLSRAIHEGLLQGFRVGLLSGTAMGVSHLLYADDVLVFCDADLVQLGYLRCVLICFEAVSGLLINLSKSELISVGEVERLPVLLTVLGCKMANLPVTYLGLPLGASYDNFIDSEILTGHFKGTRVFLHRIPLKAPENLKLPFEMTRTQFPVRLSFALTINKSQGQTIPHVGIYLPDHVFSHGQLYVALSRGVSDQTTKVLVKKGSVNNEEGVYTCQTVLHIQSWMEEILISDRASICSKDNMDIYVFNVVIDLWQKLHQDNLKRLLNVTCDLDYVNICKNG